MTIRHSRRHALLWLFSALFSILVAGIANARAADDKKPSRPNILFCISDDQSWRHAGAYGDTAINTPAFDRIAREGVLFDYAYCAAPSCTPSRGAILTGQAIYRLGPGGLLFGTLPAKFDVFPRMLEKNGYFIGHTGKTWGPGSPNAGGRKEHPVGKPYQKLQLKPRLKGMSPVDYASNFDAFLKDRPQGQPFFFWYGSSEPHRAYRDGQGIEAGKRLADAHLFKCFPDLPRVRSDVLDYYVEVEHFDQHLGRMLKALEAAGELDNTLVIVAGDHGMPFPRCKGNLYDSGTRVPLAVRLPGRVPAGRKVDDFVSLTDVAPTILAAAGVDVPADMTGRSLMPLLGSGKSGRVERERDFVVTAFERHTWCRPDGVGYPMRAIRTHRYMYIRNYEPQRWPAGDGDFKSPHQGVFGDVDRGITRSIILEQRAEKAIAPYFAHAFGRRPAEELYDMQADPDQMKNLAGEAKLAKVKAALAARLDEQLKKTGDPRVRGETPWDGYPYYFGDFWKRAKKLPPNKPKPSEKTGAATSTSATAARPPNIVFVLADDLGWAELGCYGNRFNETPNLDKLAKQGMRFTQSYAAAPVCSPFRVSLMSGQWPARVGINDYLRPGDAKHLPTEHVTLAETLKAAGYTTGMIGKWHLTGYKNHGAKEYPPTVHGFDEALVSENRGIGGGSYFHPYHFNREIQQRLPGREHLIDRCNLEAVEFIERHKDRPFFLFLSHYAVHTRLVGKPSLVAKYESKPAAGKGNRAKRNNPHLAAQLEVIDAGVGAIMDKLDELGLADNTILIFTSDNGGEGRVTSNAPLRGAKSQLYEGGIREPLIVRWPGVVKPNSECEAVTSSVDFYPTLAEAAGTKIDPRQKIDGVSLVPLLKQTGQLNRDAVYWHYPLAKPHFLGGRSSGAMRAGDWKLIEFYETGKLELYNLKDDIGEKNDLAEKMPEKTQQLQRQLQAWRKSVGAKVQKRRVKPINKRAVRSSTTSITLTYASP